MRYTAKRLEEDVQRMNRTLEEINGPLRFEVGYRNGYTAIDMVLPETERKYGCSEYHLVGGSPRECADAARDYVGRVALQKLQEQQERRTA